MVPTNTCNLCQTQQSKFNYLQLQDRKYSTVVLLWPYKDDTVYRGHSPALSPDDFHRCVELLKCLTSWESQSSPLDGYGTRVWCFTPNLPGTSQRMMLWSADLPVLVSRTNSSYSNYVHRTSFWLFFFYLMRQQRTVGAVCPDAFGNDHPSALGTTGFRGLCFHIISLLICVTLIAPSQYQKEVLVLLCLF